MGSVREGRSHHYFPSLRLKQMTNHSVLWIILKERIEKVPRIEKIDRQVIKA